MNVACLDYCLTEEERLKFERDGFFVVEDALPLQRVEELNGLVDRLYDYCVAEEGLEARRSAEPAGFCGEGRAFFRADRLAQDISESVGHPGGGTSSFITPT